MILGKIVKSNGHTDYVCQIYGPHEIEQVPSNEDYAFGTFVGIDLDASGKDSLVGLIYDTLLFNPDFGRLGPRLSSESDLQIFSPDYLNERAVLVGITVVGQMQDGQILQGVTRLAASSDALVRRLEDGSICRFHRPNGSVQLAYFPLLLQQAGTLARSLALAISGQLGALLPDQKRLLDLLADDLTWQLQINAMRGE